MVIAKRDWPTCRYFSQNNPAGAGQDNVAALLRRVADSIDQLGNAEVQDLIFHNEITAEGDWPSITVYFHEATD